MVEEEFENMSIEEQESFIDCMEELFEVVSYGNGDYYFINGEIVFED